MSNVLRTWKLRSEEIIVIMREKHGLCSPFVQGRKRPYSTEAWLSFKLLSGLANKSHFQRIPLHLEIVVANGQTEHTHEDNEKNSRKTVGENLPFRNVKIR